MSKKQKKDKAARSTRQLMGIEEIKDYCIATRMGNLVFFIIKPTTSPSCRIPASAPASMHY